MAKLKSEFYSFVQRYLPKFDNLIEKINEKRAKTLTYWYKDMLRIEFSDDGKWSSGSVNTTYVAADLVDIDSPLPVKKRDRVQVSNGDLPMFGMKLALVASQIKTIRNMVRRNIIGAALQQKLMNDKVRCTIGIQEAMEKAFLEALSRGATVMRDETHEGLGLRLNFNYLPENQYVPETNWAVVDNPDKPTALTPVEGSKPLSDMVRVLTEHPDITLIIISNEAFEILRKSDEAKELVAKGSNTTIADINTIVTPTSSTFQAEFEKEYKVTIKIDKRIVRIETPDGVRHKTRPFDITKVVFLTSDQVGALVYTDLPEDDANDQVEGVQYQKPFIYALMSMWKDNDPLREFTSIEAESAPIIENVDEIYRLDITGALEVDTTAEATDTDDSKTTIWGTAYAKTAIVSALKLLGISTTVTAKDATILKYVNSLNAEKQEDLKTILGGSTPEDLHNVNDTKEPETTVDD